MSRRCGRTGRSRPIGACSWRRCCRRSRWTDMRPMALGWTTWVFVACGADDGVMPGPACTYEELDSVATDDLSLGFSAAEVLEVANTDTTGDAVSEHMTGTWPVTFTHSVKAIGPVTEILYNPSSDPSCPDG